MSEQVLINRLYRVQAYDSKQKSWYGIGVSSETLEKAQWYRDFVLKPKRKRVKFRIIEQSVTERIVD